MTATAMVRRQDETVSGWLGGAGRPATLEAYRQAMAQAVADMDRASWRLAALVYTLKVSHYPSPEQAGEWLAAVQQTAGVSRVWAYRCLLACETALREQAAHPQILSLDVQSASDIGRITPRNQPLFWARHGDALSSLGRAQIATICGKLSKDAETAPETMAECETCGMEFAPKKDESQCPECRKAARKARRAARGAELPSIASLRTYDALELDPMDEYARALVHADRMLEALQARPAEALAEATYLTMRDAFAQAIRAVDAEYIRWYGDIPGGE